MTASSQELAVKVARAAAAVCEDDVGTTIAGLIGAIVLVASSTNKALELLTITAATIEDAVVAIARGAHRPIPATAVEVAS